jgi:hypothetical protein
MYVDVTVSVDVGESLNVGESDLDASDEVEGVRLVEFDGVMDDELDTE